MTRPLRMRLPEKTIQAQGVALLRARGAAVYVLGTRRQKGDYQGTCQTPGLPDVLAFVPVGAGVVLLFWEVKARTDKPEKDRTPEQTAFAGHCQRGRYDYVCGDVDRLLAWLVSYGLVKPENVPHYRRPAEARPFAHLGQE